MFTGSIVAIVTPFKNKQIDYTALEKLIEFHIKNGTKGIVPCGTTGEAATLTYEEHDAVIRFCIQTAKKRIPVIAGTGSNSTQEAIEMTLSAQKMGADGALLLSPYYNKPSQKGIYEHYKAITEQVTIPLILYNVPGRTASNISAETTVALSALKNIIGTKEASGNLVQVSQIIRDAKPGFLVLSGEDALTYPMMALGAQGAISVTANIAPAKMALQIESFQKGDTKKALQLHFELLDLHDVVFVETNPIPVKEALALMGFIAPEFRLPLVPLADSNRERLKMVLKKYQLIS
jgi:4-hydroxy-tetrahydrodipicolinate synthase